MSNLGIMVWITMITVVERSKRRTGFTGEVQVNVVFVLKLYIPYQKEREKSASTTGSTSKAHLRRVYEENNVLWSFLDEHTVCMLTIGSEYRLPKVETGLLV
jgi:hypothetical protein